MVGDILKQCRITRGYTQEEMAELCEVSIRTFQRYENNESLPSIPMFFFLLKFYEFDFYFNCELSFHDVVNAKLIDIIKGDYNNAL